MSKEKKEKTALFLVDCLAHMPPQPDEVKVVISGLKRIADGGEWPKSDALAAADAAYDAAARAAADAADWATAHAAYWAAAYAARAADWAAYAAARAHPDPNAERARQATVRKELGL
jgi:hypothetical protein